MNTLWLKIAGIAVVVLVVIIVAANFMGGERSTPPPPPPSETKTIYDQFKEDDKRLNAPIPSPNQAPAQAQTPQEAATPEPAGGQAVAQAPVTSAQLQGPPKFRPLEEEQQVRAEQIWQMVTTSRKMGRLPVIPYGNMVRYCRQLLSEFPGTEYAYKAKLALADIPESARKQYNVTPKELDTSEFYK